jgi:hypothetical protein
MLPQFLFGIVYSLFRIGTVPDDVLYKAFDNKQAKWSVNLRLPKEDFELFLYLLFLC